MIRHLTNEQIESRLNWAYMQIESSSDAKFIALMCVLIQKLTDEQLKREVASGTNEPNRREGTNETK